MQYNTLLNLPEALRLTVLIPSSYRTKFEVRATKFGIEIDPDETRILEDGSAKYLIQGNDIHVVRSLMGCNAKRLKRHKIERP